MNSSDKYDFILKLLNEPKLNSHQLKRTIYLASKEIETDTCFAKMLEERIEKLESKILEDNNETNIKNDPFQAEKFLLSNPGMSDFIAKKNPTEEKSDKSKSNYKVFHKPKKVTNFLKLFKKNTDLKWTTHTWDNQKYDTIEDFINGLNESNEYSFLFNHNIDLYNLIRYFIYVPKTELDKDGVPKYGWPKLPEMKFGWQYPNNLLIDWCKENYDDKSVDERKKPFQYILPEELRPPKTVKGKEIKYFEDVVNVFKTEIQFREDYLFKELRKRSRAMMDFNFLGIENAKSLSFYTYTPGVLSAIDHILEQIKINETARDVQFSFQEKEDRFIIEICQINSYPVSKELNPDNPITFVGGQLNAIAESLFSLADFSIESRFMHNGENHCGELFLTYDGIEAKRNGKNISLLSPPKFIPYNKPQNEVLGFTYKMTFYI